MKKSRGASQGCGEKNEEERELELKLSQDESVHSCALAKLYNQTKENLKAEEGGRRKNRKTLLVLYLCSFLIYSLWSFFQFPFTVMSKKH